MIALIRRASCVILALLLGAGAAGAQERSNPVGIRQIEFADGDRHLALSMFYPALHDNVGQLFVMPFFSNLNLLQNARSDFGGARRPLVMFSHGRGSNGLLYAWFAEYLAARGYIVAAINHYRANTYDANIAYAPGVDRAAIHRSVGEATKEFFDASLARSDRR